MPLKELVLLLCLALMAGVGCAARDQGAAAPAAPQAPQASQAPQATQAPQASQAAAPAAKADDDDLLAEELDSMEKETAQPLVADPLEPWNRAVYQFNDFVFLNLLDPVQRGYATVVAEDYRVAFRNFFSNLASPIRLVSSILQGDIKKAGTVVARFVVNSTMGVLGFGDAAENLFGLKKVDEDLAQAFAKWGIGDGFYIVWPLLGPSTLRDSVGLAGDSFLYPIWYLDPWELPWIIRSYEFLNESTFLIPAYIELRNASFDPYIGLRNAYIQNRRNLANR